jgi:hypothetical protein
MFELCAPEDLASEIAWDLQLDPAAAQRIAAVMIARISGSSRRHLPAGELNRGYLLLDVGF